MENSYRVASKELSSFIEVNISSMSIWNTVQTIGRYLQVEQEDLIEKDIRGDLKGKINADKIFCETDGIYVNLQKKDGLISKFDIVKFDNINSSEHIPPMGIMEANNILAIISKKV